MKMKLSRYLPRKTPGFGHWASLLTGALLFSAASVQGQKIFFEDFESLELGPNVDEALIGTEVWTKGPPDGWVADDSGVPGVGTDLNGVTEWAGWSFADKFWWSRVDSGIQRRDEFTLGAGTVMVADPDEWDDQPHPGKPGGDCQISRPKNAPRRICGTKPTSPPPASI
jgi:hypothetical protein